MKRKLNAALPLFGLLGLVWLMPKLNAAEYAYTNNYYGTAYTNYVYHDDSLTQIKGVIVTFNYGANVYSDPAWRNFAKDRSLALFLILNQDTLGIPANVPDGLTIFTNTLRYVATNGSGHLELTNSTLPVVFVGLSRGGTSGAINCGWALGANRTVACLSYHGNSFNYMTTSYSSAAAKAIPVFYPTDQLDSGPYRQTDIETAVRTTTTTTLNGTISATAYGFRPTYGLYWTTTMQYGASHTTINDDTYPLQWLGRVWDLRYNPATPGTLNAITNVDSSAGCYYLANGASSTAFYSNCVTSAFTQKDTNIWVPPGGASEWIAASTLPQAGVPLILDSTYNTIYSAPATVTNRNFINGGSVIFTGTGTIIMDNSSGLSPNFFRMTGGTLVLRNGVTLRNGANQGGIWTNNLAAMSIDATSTFDLWNGNPVFIDALTGAGTITITNSPSVNWAGARSLILGVNSGSGTFYGLLAGNAATDGGSISLTKIGLGTQTMNGPCRYSGATVVQAGTLVFGGTNAATASVEVYSNAVLQLAAGTFKGGKVLIDRGGTMSGNGTVSAPLNNNGTVLVTSGVMNFSGTVTNNGVMRFTGGASLMATNALFVNNGVLDLITGAQTLPANFINNGVVANAQQVRVQPAVVSGTDFIASIQSYAGHGYQLQRSISLGAGAVWSNIGGAQPGTGAGLFLTNSGAVSAASAFYRIAVSP